jgi:F0F1-type ATP synthase membrane subunit b/b'|tara:strand:- start:668 stop:961 length:294 start_codon:yes stop_codon:yes gene_type:complete
MAIFGIVCLVLIVGAGVLIYLQKTGKVKDEDKDLIPDAVEEVIEDAKVVAKEVKQRAKNVKNELKDVKSSAKELVKQTKDVVDAVKGKKRRGRKPKK